MLGSSQRHEAAPPAPIVTRRSIKGPSLPWFVRADDLAATLAAAAGRALCGSDCADLADLAGGERPKEFALLARGGGRLRAVAAHQAVMIDGDAVANWVVRQYE